MKLEELQKILDSLKECDPDIERFSWGPTYEFALKRKEEALKLLKQAIKLEKLYNN